ncbi:MAG: hypothetical protein IPH63_08100 [Flavobacteriales bacterium]|nr:hypothetical protein [Flavobacteriales bacterium]
MLRYAALLLGMTALVTGCKKEEAPEVDLGYTYFPTKVGTWWSTRSIRSGAPTYPTFAIASNTSFWNASWNITPTMKADLVSAYIVS